MKSGDKIVKILSVLLYFGAGVYGIVAGLILGAYSQTTILYLFTLFWSTIFIALMVLSVDTERQIKIFVFISVFSTTGLAIYDAYILGVPYLYVVLQFLLILIHVSGLRKYVFMTIFQINTICIVIMTFFLHMFTVIEMVPIFIGFALACWITIIFANRTNNMIRIISEQNQSRDDMIKLVESRFTEEKGANSAKSAFLANMSHEIRTPINAILGFNTMTMRESKEASTLEYAMEIEQASHTLLSLVNDILDISKIESGKMEISPIEYDLSSVLNDVISMISIKAKAKNIELKLDVDTTLPNRLYGDDVRIRQVLINLLNNAVKYTDSGKITLSVNGEVSEDTAILKFAVADTGIGIREEDMDKLFAKFERLDTVRNRNVEGTGLGMAITQRILSLMDSKLDVSSVYGEGSTFSFYLAQKIISDEAIGDISGRFEKSKHVEDNETRYIAPDAKVLIVDDNKTNILVFKKLLQRIKIQIDEALSGPECISLCAKNEYDIVFLDHMMPEMDGLETLEKVNTDKECLNHGTPFIALTANAISGSREFYLEAGFDDYISKPVDPKKLEKMVFDLLPDNKIESY